MKPTLEDAVAGISNRSNWVRSATMTSLRDHQAYRREIERLTRENARLADELTRVRSLHEDLTTSAGIWIRLYEAHLSRAREPEMQGSLTSMELLRS